MDFLRIFDLFLRIFKLSPKIQTFSSKIRIFLCATRNEWPKEATKDFLCTVPKAEFRVLFLKIPVSDDADFFLKPLVLTNYKIYVGHKQMELLAMILCYIHCP